MRKVREGIVIFETVSILGGALALIMVQPSLYRLFPPKPKPTQWEEFWTEAESRKRWGHCEWYSGNERAIVDAALSKRSTSAYADARKNNYIPGKEQFEASSAIFSQFQTQVAANKTAREQDARERELRIRAAELRAAAELPVSMEPKTNVAAVNAAVAKGAGRVYLPESQYWVELVTPEKKPVTDWTEMTSAEMGREAFSREAEKRGLQVYLDHKTNLYRAREKPVTVDIPRENCTFNAQLQMNQQLLQDSLLLALQNQRMAYGIAPMKVAEDQPGSTGPVKSADEDMLAATLKRGAWVDG